LWRLKSPTGRKKQQQKKQHYTMKRGNNTETATAFVLGYEMQGSNLYSNGNNIFSYSTEIASNCKGVILLNCRDYSNTTQRHKLHIRRAANAHKVTVFEVPVCYNWHGLTPDQHRTNVEYLLKEAETMRAKADRARTYKAFYRLQEEKYRQAAEDYKNTFEL